MANSNGWGDGAANNNIGWGQGANNAIGWGDIHADSWAGLTDIVGITTPPVDPDAQAFITAAAITDPTQQGAINTLVTDLKGYSIWTKMKAIYPIVGGSASSHAVNLKTPGTFNLSFSSGWTHSANGMQPNGAAYADTNFSINQMTASNAAFGIYSRTNDTTGLKVVGAYNGANVSRCWVNLTNGNIQIADTGQISYTANPSTGFFMSRRDATNFNQSYKNGVSLGSITNNFTVFNLNFYLGAANDGGAPNYYSTHQMAFAFLGGNAALTDADAINFRTAVQAYQTTLGRSIGTQTVSDADAQAFINAAGIDDQVQATAINNLVIGLKADSLWTKMKAIYPVVGGTASAHAVNLKTPGTYNLTFATGWTHGSTGMAPNGTTYANTSLIPNSVLSANSEHCSVYLRTNINAAQCDIGTANSTTQSNIFPNLSGTFYPRVQASNTGVAVNLNTAALFIANRVNSTQVQGWRNTTKYTISNNSIGLSTFSYWLADLNFNGGSASVPSTKQQAFATIGDGLTDTEASNLYTAVQAYQTTLSRNV